MVWQKRMACSTLSVVALPNDKISGGSGADSITAGSGTDNISAGDGNDTISFAAGTGFNFCR